MKQEQRKTLIDYWWNNTLSEKNRNAFKQYYYGSLKRELEFSEITLIFNKSPNEEPSHLTN